MLIFLLPLGLSVVGAAFFCFFTELDLKWKLLSAGIVGLSVCFQFVPAMQTHFLVPLIMQVIVALWVLIHFKVENF